MSGYLSQAHHLDRDWVRNGQTGVETLALACAPDNRIASEQGWVTTLGPTCRVEWIPPPALDRGQPRLNPFHFIEAVIDYRRSTSPADTPDPDDRRFHHEQPPPDSDDWPRPDDPLPGDLEYDAALQDLQDSYGAMDLDELVRQHFPADDDPLAA